MNIELGDNNEWARGCDKCKFGIASALPLTGIVSLHLERIVQAIDKQLTFCECKAGTRQRAHLLNCRQRLVEEARRDPRMADAAAKLTHPDIETARRKMAQSYEMAPAPTIHADKEPIHA